MGYQLYKVSQNCAQIYHKARRSLKYIESNYKRQICSINVDITQFLNTSLNTCFYEKVCLISRTKFLKELRFCEQVFLLILFRNINHFLELLLQKYQTLLKIVTLVPYNINFIKLFRVLRKENKTVKHSYLRSVVLKYN